MSAVTLENPYQKIGTEVPPGMTTADALVYAGLSGWNQRLVTPTVFDEQSQRNINVGRLRVNIGDLPTGTAVLGSVTPIYVPIQNEQAFTPLLDGFDKAGLQAAVLGAYDNGRSAFILFDVPGGTTRIGGDEIKCNLLVTKRNNGKGGIRAFPTAERIWCANQIDALIYGTEAAITVRHTKSADPHVVQQAEVLLGITHDWSELLSERIEDLQAIPVTAQQFSEDIVPKVLGPEPGDPGRSQTIWNRKFEEIVEAWYSPVAVPEDNAWRAWNAVSQWEQHHRSSNETKMATAVLKGSQPYSARALELLTA